MSTPLDHSRHYDSDQEDSDYGPQKKRRGSKHISTVKKDGEAVLKKALSEGRKKRLIKTAYNKGNRPKLHVRAPEYGQHDKKWGGTSVNVLLGPLEAYGRGGVTHPPPNTPRGITDVRSELADQDIDVSVVSGHLLNATFGGPNQAQNLTVLTNSANTSQITFDRDVERALVKIDELYTYLFSEGMNKKDLPFGVEYSVSVSTETVDVDNAFQYMAQSLICGAALGGEDKLLSYVGQTMKEYRENEIKEKKEIEKIEKTVNEKLGEIKGLLSDYDPAITIDNTPEGWGG